MKRAFTLIELLVTIVVIAIYWNGNSGLDNLPCFYDPPAGYDYKWFNL